MKFWIKERHNPQIGVYYVAMGKLSKKEAKRYERSLYGSNSMLEFQSEDAYKARLKELKDEGKRVTDHF